ncbi:phosphatase PAP2 family protein [Streptomyces sp. NPDC050504]|uniref:phosphatase PAP2 family protein n=1 Tax=Streptomyces sp. NPDC050504 TaxID=3365618 RepID=UPI0037A1F170
MLWTTAAVVTLGFLVVLEVVARHYGVPGPITSQAREVVFAPQYGPLLYASLALTMVVLTWRERLLAAGAAIGIDLVLTLVRWAAGAETNYGSGALWVILGLAVLAVTRRTGDERTLLLKGVALGLLLLAGRRTGDTWLVITSKTRPDVLDPYLVTADHALGNPSWLVGRLVEATGSVGHHVLDFVYVKLAVAAVVVAAYQLRNVAAERRFPRHHLVRTFLLVGLVGPSIYMIFPVVGPIFAYGADGGQWAAADVWPDALPSVGVPGPMPFDEITPRNCMPSLHTAWALVIFVHCLRGPRILKAAGAVWLVATLAATLGFGYHYGVDLVAGVVFALTIEGALRAHDQRWDRAGILLVTHGVVVFAALLVAYRYLATQMADLPWAFGPLLIAAMSSVVYHYARTTRAWDRLPEPRRQPTGKPQPQPEPA